MTATHAGGDDEDAAGHGTTVVQMVVALALGAALAYATASVLQHAVASAAPVDDRLRPTLLLYLVRRPLWLVGVVADIAGFALQAAALGLGQLVLVQPLLVSGILMALPLGAARVGRALTWREWRDALALATSLVVFLLVSSPKGGREDASGTAWAVALGVIAVGAGVAIAAGSRWPHRKAVFFGGAAGMVYAWTAALTKTTMGVLREGIEPALLSWPPYALAIAGIAGMILAQSSFQAGTLSQSLPALTIVDPVVSAILGIAMFGEQLRGGLPLIVEGAAVLGMLASASSLSRSPLIGPGEAAHDAIIHNDDEKRMKDPDQRR
jgi:hypothetical protein